MKNMTRKELSLQNHDTIPVYVFPRLEETNLVEHAFTTKGGGVSTGIYASMNLSFTRGDDQENVQENYRRLGEGMGLAPEYFVSGDQTHTTNVRKVTRQDAGRGITKERGYTDVDGLITNERQLALITYYADCVPLYLLDPVNKAIGLSHSGWRGTVGRMGQKTLLAMKEAYGTNPCDVICCIGPSICQSCYEISEEVAVQFKAEFPNHQEEILIEKPNQKYQLDLWKTNEIIFREAGVLPENIVIGGICTCCEKDTFFSHRATQGKRGNLAAVLYLK